jgi:hypothetical protein
MTPAGDVNDCEEFFAQCRRSCGCPTVQGDVAACPSEMCCPLFSSREGLLHVNLARLVAFFTQRATNYFAHRQISLMPPKMRAPIAGFPATAATVFAEHGKYTSVLMQNSEIFKQWNEPCLQ